MNLSWTNGNGCPSFIQSLLASVSLILRHEQLQEKKWLLYSIVCWIRHKAIALSHCKGNRSRQPMLTRAHHCICNQIYSISLVLLGAEKK